MSSKTIYTHLDFIDNKYNILYFKIINNAKLRSEISGYTEIHHIIPDSMGGDISSKNLVILTAREHFICHFLLTKFTINRSRDSMYKAFNMMKSKSRTNIDRYFNSRLFESSRKEFSKIMSEMQIGNKNSQFGNLWFTNTIIDISKKFNLNIVSINELLEQGWNKGRFSTKFIKKVKIPNKSKGIPLSNETKLKMSQAKIGIKLTTEHKKSISEGRRSGAKCQNRTGI